MYTNKGRDPQRFPTAGAAEQILGGGGTLHETKLETLLHLLGAI